MKRFLLVMTLVVMSVCLVAQITPYGSGRVGFWYENRDEDMTGYGESNLGLSYFLQANSRFGVDFKQESFDAKVEFGATPNLRLLWARQCFGSWSLLVGQQDYVSNQKVNQVWGSNLELVGYGAVDGGRRPQVKFEMTNGFYAALVPTSGILPTAGAIDILVPQINVGYDLNFDSFKLMPTVVFQTYSYNKHSSPGENDGNVLSLLGAIAAELKLNPFLFKAGANFGSNTGNMGFAGPTNLARWDHAKNKTIDTRTLGAFINAQMTVDANMNITLGFGYAASSNDDWENDDNRMGAYLQADYRVLKLRIIPEIGWMNEMDGNHEFSHGEFVKVSQGSLMYFGTQLRYDF